MNGIWPLVHAERHALIDDLTSLAPQQWRAASLAPGWSVHDVAAHLVDNARATTPRLLAAMVRARFNFDRQNANGIASQRGSTPQVTLARLRQVADLTCTPPVDRASRLVEEIAHGEDIRRPLGVLRTYPARAVCLAIGYQLRTPDRFGGAKKLATQVRLEASDTDFTTGTGATVRGPALELLMVASGRPAHSGSLSGPGVDLLCSRR